MSEAIDRLAKDIRAIKDDISYIKKHIMDSALSEDDKLALKEAREEYRKKETTSIEDLKNELED